ncbi:MspA family porin [Nocardia sp. NPDC052566]|uniref:MspA family porin n=1 Tax=Nocardia sp. NPDC052566 TaxID=3364330 RepID=UPI0037C6141C
MNLAGIRRGGAAAVGITALVTTALLLGTGTASADFVADKTRTSDIDGGGSLTVSKTMETVDRVPNLAATPTTREGFVSLRAIAEFAGGKADAGDISFGYQLGCQVDVSSGLTMGLGFSFGPNANLSIKDGPTIGASAAVVPNIQTTLKPGTITSVVFGTKPLAGPRASITAEGVEVKVDACMGPVTMRSFATATVKTAAADHAVTVYGDPITL